MSKKNTEHRSMAPCILLAIPQLQDPHFKKSVVLLIEHQAEGSVGLVINQPEEFSVGQLLEGLSMKWNGDPDLITWNGGPVMKEQGWVLHSPCKEDLHPEPVEVSEGIFLSGTSDQLAALAENPPENMRIYLGSSGWGENQLETEIAEGWWLTLEVEPDLIFQAPWDQVWEQCFRSMGIDPGTFSYNSSIH